MSIELDQFVEASEKVQQHLVTLIELEQEKRQALLKHDLNKVESFVQTQQSMIMKLDGLEKKRFLSQEAAGFSGKTASQILDCVDGNTKQILEPLFRDLVSSSTQLKSLNKSSLEIANSELKFMDLHTRSDEVKGLYGANGKTGNYSKNGSTFQEKI